MDRNRTVIKLTAVCLLVAIGVLTPAIPALKAQDETRAPLKKGAAAPPGKLSLGYAVMCESVKEYKPYNPGIVFSIDIGRVTCFSAFNAVPKKMFISHKWYFRDRLSTRMERVLKPPSWATVSSIQLREADKGPWRVEIVDPSGKTLRVLRFSITD
jgi:hypothetical protein